MNDEQKLAEKAELIQAVKALFIPLSLFLSCVTFAAGVFLIYHDEVAGWGFMALTAILSVWAFIALFQFQNSYRARGIMPEKEDIMVVEFSDEFPGQKASDPAQDSNSDNVIESAQSPNPVNKETLVN